MNNSWYFDKYNILLILTWCVWSSDYISSKISWKLQVEPSHSESRHYITVPSSASAYIYSLGWDDDNEDADEYEYSQFKFPSKYVIMLLFAIESKLHSFVQYLLLNNNAVIFISMANYLLTHILNYKLLFDL